MKYSILDGDSLFPSDINMDSLTSIGDFTIYDKTTPQNLLEHISDSYGIIVNKSYISKEIMEKSPNLKYIGITATGYNNIDIVSAKSHGIAVCNVPAYSTDAVAQHTFALILELTNHVGLYNKSVKDGGWSRSGTFCYLIEPLSLLNGKSLGIIGYGNIGKKVAEIGKVFGMNINIYSRDRNATMKSDIISIHCPATGDNEGFINNDFIKEMKDGAMLINTARGILVNEFDLASALKSGKLSGAAVDVVSQEPAKDDNPLLKVPNCIVTPHISWMPKETRQNLIEITAQNLKSFLNGEKLNRIV